MSTRTSPDTISSALPKVKHYAASAHCYSGTTPYGPSAVCAGYRRRPESFFGSAHAITPSTTPAFLTYHLMINSKVLK